MSSARFIVGDVLEVLRCMPDDSVDLVLTSPPFLALRSYLPADHPQKDRELGSEPTPGAFIDALLDVVEECRRVLAPHGSLCIELGDTYAGSGGGGGDYLVGGMRENQPGFGGSAERQREGNAAHWRLKNQCRKDWPQDKSLTLVPELFRIALAYGVNPLTGRTTEPWRIRNVIRWVRPNPPVGALGDKFRPATSEMVVATMSRTRYFDLDAVREARPNLAVTQGGNMDPRNQRQDDWRRGHKPEGGGVANPASAPPLDWWAIPTEPYPGSHYATWPRDLLVRPIKAMCPERVCRVCGEPSRRITKDTSAFEVQPKLAAHIKERRELVGVSRREVNAWFGFKATAEKWEGSGAGECIPSAAVWPVLKERLGLSDDFDAVVLGERRWTEDPATYEPSATYRGGLPTADAHAKAGRLQGRREEASMVRQGVTLGWTDCGCSDRWADHPYQGAGPYCVECGGAGTEHDERPKWRPGVVLDPFAGSGTTLAVATGHGRDAIGIDLDERNADLAMQRCGFFLTVEHHPQSNSA